MQQILNNLALIELMNLCKRQNIDCSGTHLYKKERGYTYGLVKDDTQKVIAHVKFFKNSTPKLFI